jgi:hypothetical protein
MSLNAIGLILNMAGTLLIIRFGLPSKIIDERGPSLVAEYSDEQLSEIKRKNKRTKLFGNIGISLIGLGFVLQFIHEFL